MYSTEADGINAENVFLPLRHVRQQTSASRLSQQRRETMTIYERNKFLSHPQPLAPRHSVTHVYTGCSLCSASRFVLRIL